MMDWPASTMIGRSMGIDVSGNKHQSLLLSLLRTKQQDRGILFGEFEKPLMNQIINHILQLKQRHHTTKLFVDGANPEVI